jgi:hypothetical protein
VQRGKRFYFTGRARWSTTPELAMPTDPASGASLDVCPATFP